MRRHEITDEQWTRLDALLPGREGTSGRRARDNRAFVNAVVWIGKTGSPWRDLPERFGPWNSVYQRFRRWARTGRWQRIFEALQDADLEWLMIDSTSVRAHQHASGQKGGPARTHSAEAEVA